MGDFSDCTSALMANLNKVYISIHGACALTNT
nr:MAG TPA: hypothetical protein [Caudoviricetes sp.]